MKDISVDVQALHVPGRTPVWKILGPSLLPSPCPLLAELICEPSYFKKLNSELVMEKYLEGAKCSSVDKQEDIYYPAFQADSGLCTLQGHSLLYSCVGEHPDLSRLCPCRDFIKGQTALCPTCL